MTSLKPSCRVVNKLGSCHVVVNELGSCVRIIIMRDLTVDIVNVTNVIIVIAFVNVIMSDLSIVIGNAITKGSLCVTIISVIPSVIPSIGLCSINSLRPFVVNLHLIINYPIIIVMNMVVNFGSSTRMIRLSPCDYDVVVVHMILSSPCVN